MTNNQLDDQIKELFDMVYQWGRVGVVVDHTAPAFQDKIKAIRDQREAEARKEGEQRALDCISIDRGFWASTYNVYTETLGLPQKSHDYVDNLHLKKHEFSYPKDIELRRHDG